MKNKTIAFFYSLALLFVWSSGMINIDADQISIILALSFTFLATYFFNEAYDFNLPEKIIILIIPTLYFCTYTYLFESMKILFLMNPLLIALIFLLLSLSYMSDLSRPINLFLFVFSTLFYTHLFYPIWEAARFSPRTEKIGKDTVRLNELPVKDSIKLKEYLFINRQNDTSNIVSDKKFTLIETWNETCPPCIKAFEDLPDFYNEHKNTMETFYLYETNKDLGKDDLEKVFNFPKIKEKSKIKIDLNQNLYDGLEMRGYPYFLLFDSNGKLIFIHQGYKREFRKELEAKIKSIIG